LGIATIPIRFRDKRPLVSWSRFQKQLPTPAELINWFTNRVNQAVITGWQNLTVIDFDNLDMYFAWHAWATNEGGIASDVAELTYQVITARGVHVYVSLDEPPAGNM